MNLLLLHLDVRAVTLENLVTVSVLDRPVPEILGFGKRTETQNEVLDSIGGNGQHFQKCQISQKHVSEIFKNSECFCSKNSGFHQIVVKKRVGFRQLSISRTQTDWLVPENNLDADKVFE